MGKIQNNQKTRNLWEKSKLFSGNPKKLRRTENNWKRSEIIKIKQKLSKLVDVCSYYTIVFFDLAEIIPDVL